jgi:hypothetical protein
MEESNSATPQPAVNWLTTKQGKRLTVRINQDADLSRYRAITVEAVAYTGPATKLKPGEADKLSALLRDALSKELSNAKLNSGSSAAGALTLQANITRVRRSRPWVNVFTTAVVFVPLDLGAAKVTSQIVDQETGQIIAKIETEGCGQIYQVLPSFQALGQSKVLLKKQGRSIAKEVAAIDWNSQAASLNAAAISPLK